MFNKIKQLFNSWRTPKAFNVTYLLNDYMDNGYDRVITVAIVGYSSFHAKRSAKRLAKDFNLIYSANYRFKKVEQMSVPFLLKIDNEKVNHYEINLGNVNYHKNLQILKYEFDVLKKKWVNAQTDSR